MSEEEHTCTYKDTILNMRDDVSEIKEALLGTFDKKGLVSEVKENTNHRKGSEKKKKFHAGKAVDALYKIIVGVVLAIVASR